jgi:predicted PurR-regulated permease PerM
VSSPTVRRYVLAAVLAGLLVAAALLLRAVIATAFFAVTVAYVLHPARAHLRERGLSRRATAASLSAAVFGLVVVTFGLASLALYRRRQFVIELLREIPDTVTVSVGEVSYSAPTTTFVDPVVAVLRGTAVAVASAAPVLALKLLLFAIVLYGLLLHPDRAGHAVFNVVPPEYHDLVRRFHERTRETLYGIYVLQAATAAGTFALAVVTFAALGYQAPVTLAVIAGVLQFIPVVGPGVLLGVLALLDVVAGNLVRAALVAVVGGFVVGLVPDAIIRPRLASYAAHLPVSLYFVGFVGGVLSLGTIGFIAGPLIVALVVEAVALLSERRAVEGDAAPR